MVVRNWIEVIQTSNLSKDKEMDTVSKWLLITRAAVFSMTLTSAMIGGLLAASVGEFSLGPFFLATVGLLLAHAANNMINDYYDLSGGVDTADYPRALYAPHPILSGMVTKSGLRNAILLVNFLDVVIAAYLVSLRGWPVVVFAGLGFFISFFYVAPPIRLKHIGLGEIGVFLVWGPLMTGGVYYVTAGTIPLWVLGASLPYAIVVMTVLMGKHLDKFEHDKAKGIHTLPVLLGYDTARYATMALMVSFYVIVVAMVATGALGPWTLLIVFSLPRLVRVLNIYAKPKPAAPPPNFPVWPLWYVAAAFYLTKLTGGMFILGLLLNLIF